MATCDHHADSGLWTLSYCSEAGARLQTADGVANLVVDARRANLAAGVSGAIACEDGHIRQWIEGPKAAVQALWDRIRLDPRHRVQWAETARPLDARLFPQSPMRLALTRAAIARLKSRPVGDMFGLPPREAAPPLAPCTCGTCTCPASCTAGSCGAADPALWQLDAVYRAQRQPTATHWARDFAGCMSWDDTVGARSLADATLAGCGPDGLGRALTTVLDRLQEDWLADALTGTQRAMALSVLQGALRPYIDIDEPQAPLGFALVSLMPGAADCLGVMLKAALLRKAGWSVRIVLPRQGTEIAGLAHALRPDLIVLAGSRLSATASDLAALHDLVPLVTQRQGVPVILGGKLAEAQPEAVLETGARAVCATPGDIAEIAFPFASQTATKAMIASPAATVPSASQRDSARSFLVRQAFAALARGDCPRAAGPMRKAISG